MSDMGMALIASLLSLVSPAATVWPAPAGACLAQDWSVRVDGAPCPVYACRVPPRDKTAAWLAVDDWLHAPDLYETAGFANFGMSRPVSVSVDYDHEVGSVKVLPTNASVKAKISGHTVTFTLAKPQALTIEVDGEWNRSLHLFANPPEENVPSPKDPNVIYFGPGLHTITHLLVGSGKTVYIAGGAVLKCEIGADETGWPQEAGRRGYPASIELHGVGITLRGRGIIEGGDCPVHSRNLMFAEGTDIRVEGVVLNNSPVWTLPIRRSNRVIVENTKLFGYRANSDGIDICNSRDVTVRRCFIRTNDDLIVVKSDKGQGAVRHIVAQQCVLWNEIAHALSIGAELQEPIDDVLFEDCDVIHDKGREWSLRVYHCDSAKVSNIVFRNLRIEETHKFISLWIGPAIWSRDRGRGEVDNVTFRNISATGDPGTIELQGFDETHKVSSVLLDGVVLNGRAIQRSDIHTNAFTHGVTVRPG